MMNKVGLKISDYAKDINLYDEYIYRFNQTVNKEAIVDYLLDEMNETVALGTSYKEKRRFLHGKLNMLHPNVLNNSAISKLNDLLQQELLDKDIKSVKDIVASNSIVVGNTKVSIWQGDITTLKIDAIVNAANSLLLGCFHPLHACIDNAIHTAAGVQLRDDCYTIMKKQGFEESTGTAKVTRAYNLPSKYVLHTVGPIVQGYVSEKSKEELASAYISCLEICKEIESIRSIAFCGISTGVFGYPAEQAAKVAYTEVSEWLQNNPECLDAVVFNVFSDKDRSIYESLIR